MNVFFPAPARALVKWLTGLMLVWLLCTQATASDTAATPMRALRVPPITGHLVAADLGLVINTADPYSVAVGEYYAQRRGIAPQQIVRVSLPLRNTLTVAEFEVLAEQIRTSLAPQIQALAIAWARPYAVECNSITSALTLGFQPDLCKQSCAPSAASAYFNSASPRPFTDLGIRPSMLLAARSVEAAKALIERGISSDQQLGKRGVPEVQALFVRTQDAARNVRSALYPPSGRIQALGMQIANTAEPLPALPRVMLLQIGQARVEGAATIHWVPGALADHLTSFGGQLFDGHDQMTALDWLDAGATASYGTVTEPCNHVQKFPHPQVLLLNYLQGSTALEAYWRSVAWPAQGLFVGEPLAAPFGH